MKYQDLEVGFDFEPEPGLADNGDLEIDLQALVEAAGSAAQAAETAIAIFLDEMQYIREPELAALITALHRTAQRSLPVVLVGAGLPQLRGRMGNAKSYAERLFDFPQIGPLSPEDAVLALRKPIEAEGCTITDEALDAIFAQTQGYPYFLQEWGKHAWEVADDCPLTLDDVRNASPVEKRYLRAMAELGPGPHRSGDIADKLRRPVSALSPTRSSLINKGMVYSPSHGDTAFTVPLFDEFMKRIVPDFSLI